MNNIADEKTLTDSNQPIKRPANAVVLPDGTRKELMGSGHITSLLGVGGMANVYEIWNPQLEISRAVKLLHPNYTEEAKQRFETEIKITAKLHHPNIIEIHAVGHWNGLPYIEMERIYGEALDKLISERGALPTEVCTSIGIMMGKALRFAHNQEYVIYGKTYYGVIHRDLKPSNIMISYKGVLKLMDFGIARPTDASIHTTDGSILGTMQYLSPEQLEGKEANIRSDVYSLGTVLYEMLAGVKAFPEQNVSKLMMSKVKNDFLPLDNFNVKIPLRLRRLVHRCLSHNPDRRVPDTTHFLEEIGRIHRQLTNQTPEQVLRKFIGETSSKRRILSVRKRIPVKVIILACLLLFISISVFKYGGSLEQFIRQSLFQKKDVSGTVIVNTTPVSKKQNIANVNNETEMQPHTVPLPVHENTIKKQRLSTPSEQVESVPVISSKVVSETKSFIDSLKTVYGTDDIKLIFEKEVLARNFKKAIQVYDSIPESEKHAGKTVIYMLRSYRGVNDLVGLRKMLERENIDDAEFYLEFARLKLDQNNLDECLKYLSLCEKTAAAFTDSKNVRIERLYLTAVCRNKLFNQSPSNDAKKAALDSWFEIKAELQMSQDHRYFKEADQEMQRITKRN